MKTTALKRTLLGSMMALCLAAIASANPAFAGHWRLDTAHSTALDGWSDMDLLITLDGTKVAIEHDMQWGATKYQATNTVDTAQPVALEHFFRVEQRHMAVYAAKGGITHATASWIDGGRTLRVEADTPVEVSQGDVPMRIYSEYRVSELGDKLTLIELHSSRNRPLVYVFRKVQEEKK